MQASSSRPAQLRWRFTGIGMAPATGSHFQAPPNPRIPTWSLSSGVQPRIRPLANPTRTRQLIISSSTAGSCRILSHAKPWPMPSSRAQRAERAAWAAGTQCRLCHPEATARIAAGAAAAAARGGALLTIPREPDRRCWCTKPEFHPTTQAIMREIREEELVNLWLLKCTGRLTGGSSSRRCRLWVVRALALLLLLPRGGGWGNYAKVLWEKKWKGLRKRKGLRLVLERNWYVRSCCPACGAMQWKSEPLGEKMFSESRDQDQPPKLVHGVSFFSSFIWVGCLVSSWFDINWLSQFTFM